MIAWNCRVLETPEEGHDAEGSKRQWGGAKDKRNSVTTAIPIRYIILRAVCYVHCAAQGCATHAVCVVCDVWC